MKYSENWKHWVAHVDERTCRECREKRGKVYATDEEVKPYPPLHPRCRCEIKLLPSAEAGTLTPDKTAGVDWFVKYLHELPDNYLTAEDAKREGWKPQKGNLAEMLPGYKIFGGVYENRNGHLPQTEGRIWYEADLSYSGGYRNRERLVFSNDGLVFATYDHYETFTEII